MNEAPAPQVPRAVGRAEAFRFWLKLGFVSFGGPAGQIAIMHEELVQRRRWISERRYLHALNYCMLLPGPEAQQLATYVGWLLHGAWGGIVAGSLFVLPSLVLLVSLSALYVAHGEQPLVAGLLYGIKPAVVAIVAFAAWRIGRRALRNAVLWSLSLLAFLAIAWWRAPFPAVVATAALAGLVGGRLAPRLFALGGASHGAEQAVGPALIDDHTPPPTHARLAPGRLARAGLLGLGLWVLTLGALVLAFGAQGTLPAMGWFFTKAALMTFGGAYAVLPYVYQGAVAHYGWLTAGQMMDGLALGETTPGPLIMVVAFVGYLGAHGAAGGGTFQAGAAGACVATFFTFLPSFLFILVGAPLVEATRGQVVLTAPLTAVTAAVVGVVFSLACFFGWHVLWPQGAEGPFDPAACALALAAAAALWRGLGIVPVIAASGVLGLLWRSLA